MRVIKFRYWDGKDMIYNPFSFGQNYPMNDLLQFVGHVDCKNVEIYEGDILRETIEMEEGDINHYFVVTWISEWAMFAALLHSEHDKYLAKGVDELDESMFWTFTIEKGNDFTVCGNIHEHPDYIRKCLESEDITEGL
jgi:hypothetical protein